jgi:hypothetical protein
MYPVTNDFSKALLLSIPTKVLSMLAQLPPELSPVDPEATQIELDGVIMTATGKSEPNVQYSLTVESRPNFKLEWTVPSAPKWMLDDVDIKVSEEAFTDITNHLDAFVVLEREVYTPVQVWIDSIEDAQLAKDLEEAHAHTVFQTREG